MSGSEIKVAITSDNSGLKRGLDSSESSLKSFGRKTAKYAAIAGAAAAVGLAKLGQVSIKAAGWNREFLTEHEEFPNGKFKDQVDATAGAFNKLAAAIGSYDKTLSWVG